MKARRMDKKFFDHPVQPHICVLENIELDEEDIDSYITAVGSNLFTTGLKETLMQFTRRRTSDRSSANVGDVTDIRKFWRRRICPQICSCLIPSESLKVLEQMSIYSQISSGNCTPAVYGQ
jgi:hypothetical protein